MVICGALLQILPVLVGTLTTRPRFVSVLIHSALTPGVLTLGAAFVTGQRTLFVIAVILLTIAFSVLLAVTSSTLLRARSQSSAANAINLALAAFVITISLGIYAVLLRTDILTGSLAEAVAAHIAWGVLGWFSLLIVGIAYHVVPMFQMTDEYPMPMQRSLGIAVALMLAVWSLSLFSISEASRHAFQIVAEILLVLIYGGFALTTLWLQQHRRRRLPDVTLWYWRTAMLALLATLVLWLVGTVSVSLSSQGYYPLLLGVMMIGGFVISVISGMLFKIVPFLSWLHLHTQWHVRDVRNSALPSMKYFIPEHTAQRQYYSYLLALALLLSAVYWPAWFTYPAALAWLSSSLLLWWNIVMAARRQRLLLVSK